MTGSVSCIMGWLMTIKLLMPALQPHGALLLGKRAEEKVLP